MRRCFRYFVVALLVASCAVVMPARNCMAATSIPYNTIIWGPQPRFWGLVDSTAVIVCARNRFAAAMTILGYGTRVDSLTPEQMAYLSNGPTGGEFFTFANNVRQRNGLNFDNYDDLYGHDNVWYTEYSSSEFASAQADLETVLSGGHVGGGGSSDGEVSDTYTLDNSNRFNPNNYTYNVNGSWPNGRPNRDGTGFVWNVSITAGVKADAETYKETHPYVCVWNNFPGNLAYFYGGRSYYGHTHLSMSTSPFYLDSGGLKTDGAVVTWYDSQSFTLNITNDVVVDRAANPWQASPGRVLATDGWSTVGNVGTPTVPPTNWPDAPEPTTPTAPEVPTPEPTTPTPEPTTPTSPTIPIYAPQVTYPDVTYDTPDLSAVLDALNEHCQHLQSAIYQGFSDYFDTFTPWLRDEFSTLRTFMREEDDWIVESISDEFMELRSYLKELAEWLADQMDFTISGGDYDDSTVVSWLKKIYYKLGGASVNTKPVDPVGDPDGTWDWLNQLIEGILSALANGAANLAGSLGELFQGIKDKFPFSIPWDIVAIVALLDAAPVTPEFVIEYDVFGAHVRYDIDLHFFDEQAAVIRAMENVLFCAFLLFKTNWLNSIFDGIGDFLGGKLKSTVKSP